MHIILYLYLCSIVTYISDIYIYVSIMYLLTSLCTYILQTLVLRGLEAHFEAAWERHTVAAAQAKTALDWIQSE